MTGKNEYKFAMQDANHDVIIVLNFVNIDVNRIRVTEETEIFFFIVSTVFITDKWLAFQGSVCDRYLSDKDFRILTKDKENSIVPLHRYFIEYKGKQK